MIGKSRRLTTGLVIIVGSLVLVIAGFALRDRVFEQWLLWKLESGNEQARKIAAERLGEMRSARAAPRLVQILRERAQTADEIRAYALSTGLDMTEPFWEEDWTTKAIAAIGVRAIPAIAEVIKDETSFLGTRDAMDAALHRIIEEMGSSPTSRLMEMLHTKNPNTRRLAALVLKKLGHEPEQALESLPEAHRSAWRSSSR